MGTKMYLYAIIATPIILAMFAFIDYKNLFAGETTFTKILKIQMHDAPVFQHVFDEILSRHTKYFTLDAINTFIQPADINLDNTNTKDKINTILTNNSIKELSFTIIHNDSLDMEKFFKEIAEKNSGKNITLLNVQ